MNRIPDETLLWVASVRSMVAITAALFMGSALIGVPHLLFTIGALLVLGIGLADAEAAKRAGSREGLEAWRESRAWTADEFTINHDYGPDGIAFRELVGLAKSHGYTVAPASPATGTSVWRFVRSGIE